MRPEPAAEDTSAEETSVGRGLISRTAPDQVARAVELCFRRLGRRESTVEEMREHLKRREVGADVITAAIEQLHGDGYLDDARYARMFVEDRQRLDGWGSGRIRRDLAGRGVPREIVDAALEAAEGSGEAELDRALDVLRRRFADPPTERRERERALGMLLRKGYSSELALDALAAHARPH